MDIIHNTLLKTKAHQTNRMATWDPLDAPLTPRTPFDPLKPL